LRGIDTAEVRELNNVRPIQEENLGYRIAETGGGVHRRASYGQRGSSSLNTSARDAEARDHVAPGERNGKRHPLEAGPVPVHDELHQAAFRI
jgi:hypothetical protein